MKCINSKNGSYIVMLVLICMMLTGCGRLKYDLSYQPSQSISTYDVIATENQKTITGFADPLCVTTTDVLASDELDMSAANAAILCDINNKQVIYAKNVHDRINPASLTKVMTALCALRYGSLNQTLTATNAVNVSESGATLCGLKSGDTMTLDQALRIMLVYSANDAALLIADNIGGSVDKFIEMMNEEAARLGATNTHFMNPSGLTDAEHYTTVYDLYLIFNEAIKYETFTEIIQMTGYQTTYYDKNGKEKQFDKSTTNGFLRGSVQAPKNITIIGGKTGTTNAAGHCLMLLSRDVKGAPYISIVMGAATTDDMYLSMNHLLEEIGKIPE